MIFMKKIAFIFFLLLMPGIVKSEIYLEISLEGGGKTFATATRGNDDFSFDEDLNIGGGFKFAAGVHNLVGENDRGSISLALGYLWDSIDAENGDAEFNAFTFDAIYNLRIKLHRIGIGATYHINPEYEDDIDGFAETNIESIGNINTLFSRFHQAKKEIHGAVLP